MRLIKNSFFTKVEDAYNKQASVDELKELLGKGRARKGIFEGDLEEGELEIGQVSALINDCPMAKEIIDNLVEECNACLEQATTKMI